jgi:hypothetical protein
MKNIIDDTIDILASMNLQATRVTTPPGYAGLQIELPNDVYSFFVWKKLDDKDFAFRVARFWEKENPFSMMNCTNLIEALSHTQVLIK